MILETKVIYSAPRHRAVAGIHKDGSGTVYIQFKKRETDKYWITQWKKEKLSADIITKLIDDNKVVLV